MKKTLKLYVSFSLSAIPTTSTCVSWVGGRGSVHRQEQQQKTVMTAMGFHRYYRNTGRPNVLLSQHRCPLRAASSLISSLLSKILRSPSLSSSLSLPRCATELSGNRATPRHATTPEVQNQHRWIAKGLALEPRWRSTQASISLLTRTLLWNLKWVRPNAVSLLTCCPGRVQTDIKSKCLRGSEDERDEPQRFKFR